MSRFEGRVAIVTGAAEGLGFGIAQRLGGEGARVAPSAPLKWGLDSRDADGAGPHPCPLPGGEGE